MQEKKRSTVETNIYLSNDEHYSSKTHEIYDENFSADIDDIKDEVDQ